MTQEKKRLVYVSIGALVFGGLLTVVGCTGGENKRGGGGDGDTPVVIIGGSLDFKAGAKNITWDGPPFSINPHYQIGTIAVKAKADPDTGDGGDDTKASTDKLAIDVSTADSWKVEEFTSADSDDNPSVTITPTQGSNTINLTVNHGSLCRDPDTTKRKKWINYTAAATCPVPTGPPYTYDPVAFSRVRVTVNDQPIGMLYCVSGNGKNKCRVVFRKAN